MAQVLVCIWGTVKYLVTWEPMRGNCLDSKWNVSTIDIVSSQLYVCHILVSKKCQLQAGTIQVLGKRAANTTADRQQYTNTTV